VQAGALQQSAELAGPEDPAAELKATVEGYTQIQFELLQEYDLVCKKNALLT
jgi:hypothetical protein